MTDVERFFRRLVANLASSDPARLHHPIPLEDVYQSIIPYRSNRRALHLETSEDYEMVLLRLCAGEGDLVRTEPEEARVEFEEELKSTNPDLSVLRRLEQVVISLRSEPLARSLDPEPDAPYLAPSAAAPPAPPLPGLDLSRLEALAPLDDPDALFDEDPLPDQPGEAPLDDDGGLLDEPAEPLLDEDLADEPAQPAPHCLSCGDRLPSDRPVRFCPHCGQRQAPPECPRCHSEVEPDWRHCVSCGAALAAR